MTPSSMTTPDVLKALSALAQDSRLAIFRLLVQTGPEGMAASKIADELGIAPSSLSFHLKELTNAQLIASRSASRFVIYSTDTVVMNGLIKYLTDNCCGGQSCSLTAVSPTPSSDCTESRSC